MGDDVRAAGDVDCKRAADVEPGRPVDRLGAGVKPIGVGNFKIRQRQQDAAGEARPQAGAVGVEPGSVRGDTAAAFGDIGEAEVAKLIGE